MKKGKINPTETACIKGMLADGIPMKQMSSQLDRTPAAIQKEIDHISQQAMKDEMFIKTTAKGEGGIVVMTQNTSTKIDENRKKNASTQQKGRRDEWVHTIFDKKK